jgi:hypothetical protein
MATSHAATDSRQRDRPTAVQRAYNLAQSGAAALIRHPLCKVAGVQSVVVEATCCWLSTGPRSKAPQREQATRPV